VDTEISSVECPVCGGLIEAADDEEVVRLAALHTRDAHAYDVPADHVRARIEHVVPDA
jgi:predicted small metal-binding protein